MEMHGMSAQEIDQESEWDNDDDDATPKYNASEEETDLKEETDLEEETDFEEETDLEEETDPEEETDLEEETDFESSDAATESSYNGDCSTSQLQCKYCDKE